MDSFAIAWHFLSSTVINQHTLTATTNGFRKVHRSTFEEIFYFIRFPNKLLYYLTANMVKQSDIVNTKSLEDCGSHGKTDDEYEEYSEEEMFSEEESNENLCMPPKKEGSCEILSKLEGSSGEEPNEDSLSDEESEEEVPCGDESDDEDSCPEETNNEDPEESEAVSAEYPANATTLEETCDEDPSDVSFEEIIEEEFYEESDEEPTREVSMIRSMDRPPPEEHKASDHIFSESKTSAESSCNHSLRESTNLSTNATVSKQPDEPPASSRKRRSRWDIKAEAPMLENENGNLHKKRKTRWSIDTKIEAPIAVNDNAYLNKRRKTRWSSDETQLNLSCTLMLSNSVKDILSDTYNDQRIQRLNAKLQEINQKLESGVIVNESSLEESSTSPQPIDVGLHSGMDTLEFRIISKLLKQKQEIISELLTKSKKNDIPKSSKHHYTFSKKLYIPSKEYPNYNFVGLILGPNGNTMKKMEKETGAIIKLRGIGVKDKKTKASHDDMHVLIQSDSQSCLDAAVSMVEKLLVPVDDSYNYHKAAQLRELAELRGTLDEARIWKLKSCDICGKSCHPTSDCPLIATASKANANFHTRSGSLFSSFSNPSVSSSPLPLVAKAYGDKPKEIDPTNLFVGLLPQSVSSDKLKELFLPYGSICKVAVLTDKSTGRSKGCGFVKYATANDASKAIEKMNGYMIDGKKLAVRIAGASPPSTENLPKFSGSVSSTPPLIANLPNFPGLIFIPSPSSNANLPNYIGIPHPSNSTANLLNHPGLASIPLPSNANMLNYPGLVAIPQEVPKPNFWPGPPGSMLPESGIPFPKSSCNSLTYAESAPLQSSTSLGSSFQTTSLGKNGYMMDEKKLNVTVTGTPPPSLTRPPGSTLPESDPHFSKSSYNSLKNTENSSSRYSAYVASTRQTSLSSSQFSGVTAISNELASFPGYLKSFDPPDQLNRSMPSSSVSSRAPYCIGNFSGNQWSPTWR